MKLSRYTQTVEYEEKTIIFNLLNDKRAICTDASDLAMIDRLSRGDFIEQAKLSEGVQTFCVDENIDERKVCLGLLQSAYWNRQQLSFIVLPTMDCMFRCKYCYEDKDHKKIDEDFMDDFLEAIKTYHAKDRLKNLSIEWYGGEPLMVYEEIVNFTKSLNHFCDTENIEHTYSMTTNGFLLSFDRAKTLIDLGIRKFQITVDGVKETHDKLRPHKNGEGTWDTIIKNLLALKNSDLDFHVMIRVNYDVEVVERISEFHEFVKDNFDDRFTVFHHVISKWGGANDQEMDLIDPSTSQYVDTLLVDEAVNKNLKPDMNFYFSKFGGRVCYANRPYFYILSLDRKLRKCTFTDEKYDALNVVGHLLAGKFEIDEKKLLNFIMPDYEKMKEKGCYDCQILPICHGLSCALRRAENQSIDCVEEKINVKENIVQEYKYYLSLRNKNKKVKSNE